MNLLNIITMKWIADKTDEQKLKKKKLKIQHKTLKKYFNKKKGQIFIPMLNLRILWIYSEICSHAETII